MDGTGLWILFFFLGLWILDTPAFCTQKEEDRHNKFKAMGSTKLFICIQK